MQPTKKVSLSFDIEIEKKISAAAPEVKKRLEAESKKSSSLTLEDINEKMQHAAENRQHALEQHCSAAKESLEKVGVTKERKLSAEHASEDRIAAELAHRLSLAEEKRTE